MSIMDDYFSTVTEPNKAEFERIRNIVTTLAPSMEEGTSYGMPAYLYNGKPLLSAVANKRFLSIYPFSGKVIEKLQDKLAAFECTSGSIHFSAERPLPAALLEEIIRCRLQEIDTPKRKA